MITTGGTVIGNRTVRKKGAFYRPAEVVLYDIPANLPSSVHVEHDSCLRRLQELSERDMSFRRRLDCESDNSVFGDFLLQLRHYKSKEFICTFTWTDARKEIKAALLERADFELLQLEHFVRNLRWIAVEQRQMLLNNILVGMKKAHSYLYCFQEVCEDIKAKARALKTHINGSIDLGEPETILVPLR